MDAIYLVIATVCLFFGINYSVVAHLVENNKTVIWYYVASFLFISNASLFFWLTTI